MSVDVTVYSLREEEGFFHSLYVRPDDLPYIVNVPMRTPGSIKGNYLDRVTAAQVLRYWRTKPGFARVQQVMP